MRPEVLGGLLDGSVEGEAEIAVSWANRIRGARVRRRVRSVDVELGVTDAVRETALRQLDDLGAEHRAVEIIGSFPVRDRDHDVVDSLDHLCLRWVVNRNLNSRRVAGGSRTAARAARARQRRRALLARCRAW